MKFSFVVLLSIVFLFLPAGARAEKPNLVLVQVDDLAPGLLRTPLRDGKPAMPFLEKSIDSGTFFSSAHNSTPLCSPSRAALLSGQFSHNNHIVGNSGANGGWDGWQQSPALRENLATLLQREGYLTAHLGKWTNHYDDRAETPLRTPPGWDIWYSDVREASRGGFYGYRQFMRHPRLGIFDQLSPPLGNPDYTTTSGIDSSECRISSGGECYYHSDVISRQALDIVRFERGPLYIHLDYYAPHGDSVRPLGPQPATRHIGLAKGVPIPKNPSYNERNTSDKDYLIQRFNGSFSRRAESSVAQSYRSSLESLRAVDEGLKSLTQALREKNELENTFFVFTSDNGYFYGEHRFLAGKALPYNTAAEVPTAIWGPGILSRRYKSPISTTDIAPTILALLQARSELPADGEDLSQFLREGTTGPRRAILSERISPKELADDTLPFIRPLPLDASRPTSKAPDAFYRSLKIGRYRYTKYTQGREELYDLRQDPYQLYNQAGNPSFFDHLRYMREMLGVYRSCVGESCLLPPPDPPESRKIRSDASPPPRRIGASRAYLWREKIYLNIPCRRLCWTKAYLGSEKLFSGRVSGRTALPVPEKSFILALRSAERRTPITLRFPSSKKTLLLLQNE